MGRGPCSPNGGTIRPVLELNKSDDITKLFIPETIFRLTSTSLYAIVNIDSRKRGIFMSYHWDVSLEKYKSIIADETIIKY